MSAHASSSHSHDVSHHIVPIPVYAATLAALAGLMGATIFAAQIHWPGGTVVNNIIAMAIAVVKATLVVLVFMNVRNGTKLIKMWAMLGFAWFTLMFMMYCDYLFRQYELTPAWDARDPGSAMSRIKAEPAASDPNMVNVRVR